MFLSSLSVRSLSRIPGLCGPRRCLQAHGELGLKAWRLEAQTGCSVRKRLIWSTGRLRKMRDHVPQDSSDARLNKYELWIRELPWHGIGYENAGVLITCIPMWSLSIWRSVSLIPYICYVREGRREVDPSILQPEASWLVAAPANVGLAWKLDASLSVGLFKRWTVQHIDLTWPCKQGCLMGSISAKQSKTLKDYLRMVHKLWYKHALQKKKHSRNQWTAASSMPVGICCPKHLGLGWSRKRSCMKQTRHIRQTNSSPSCSTLIFGCFLYSSLLRCTVYRCDHLIKNKNPNTGIFAITNMDQHGCSTWI